MHRSHHNRRTDWKQLSTGEKVRYSERRKAWVYEDGTPVQQPGREEQASSSTQRSRPVYNVAAPVAAMARASLRDASAVGAVGNIPFDDSASNPVRQVTGRDPDSGVETNWEIGRTRRVLGNRTRATKKIRGRSADDPPEQDEDGNSEDEEDEDGNEDDQDDDRKFTRSRHPTRDYQFGNVIEMHIVPPPAEELSEATAMASTIRYPRLYHRGITRFVVMRPSTEDNPTFMALPIKMYGGLGVAAQNVVKSHHVIIYTREPQMRRNEHPHPPERGMRDRPIRVIPIDRTRPLDPMARLDLFDEYDFEADVPRTRVYGRVHRDSLPSLRSQYAAVRAEPQSFVTPPNVAVGDLAEGAISLAQVAQILQGLSSTARANDLQPIPSLSLEQRQYLAQNPLARRQFVSRIRETWRPVLLARRNAEQANTPTVRRGSDVDDDDDDNDDDDEEEGDEEANDNDAEENQEEEEEEEEAEEDDDDEEASGEEDASSDADSIDDAS